MYTERKKLYEKLEENLDSKIVLYATSDRRGAETQIGQDVIDIFIAQLDKIGVTKKISLILYTRGGDTAAAWNLVNLLKQFCDEFQVIIPHRAHSAGTLISLGANSIIMTKQATLSPIDPSVNTPLNPIAQTGQMAIQMPVSVEAIKGYLAFAREELSIEDDLALSNIMVKLSEKIHPLVLGQVFRARMQIKMLGEKLLSQQVSDTNKMKEILSFLCSDSGSHDYTINRREARDVLGLNIIKPDEEMYAIIKAIYDDFSKELGFGMPFNPVTMSQTTKDSTYYVKRALVESLDGGADYLSVEGKIIRMAVAVGSPVGLPAMPTGAGLPPQQIREERLFEGWKHES